MLKARKYKGTETYQRRTSMIVMGKTEDKIFVLFQADNNELLKKEEFEEMSQGFCT